MSYYSKESTKLTRGLKKKSGNFTTSMTTPKKWQLSLFAGCIAFVLTACGSSRNLQQFLYFQNGIDTSLRTYLEPRIQPNDLLSIQVLSTSLNQQQTEIFNLFNSGLDKSGVQGYQVNANGAITIPQVGDVPAAGLTRLQLEAVLAQKLTPFVKDPTVLVRFLQYNVNVLGEVRRPGKQTFLTDKVTLLDAISAAGDMTDYGRRDNVTVVREQGGKRQTWVVDMSDGKALFSSPAYQLLANDVVYVSPAQNKLKNLAVNPETQRRTGLILNLVGVATTVTTLIFTINR